MKVKITSCSDAQYWYADMVGEEVYCLREESGYFWVKTPDTTTNFVKTTDGELIDEH